MRRPLVLLGIVLALTIPVLGLVGFAILLLLKKRFASQTDRLYELHEEYVNSERIKGDSTLIRDSREFERQQLNIQPLSDMISSGETNTRVSAIKMLGHLADKTSINLLHRAEYDYRPEVRFHAADQIARLNETFQEQILWTRKEVSSHPDAAIYHKALANICLEYYESGLLDEEDIREYLDLSKKEYMKVIELLDTDTKIYNNLGRIYAIQKDFKTALKWYSRTLHKNRKDFRALIGLAECYWALGKYHLIPRIFKQIQETYPKSNQFKDIVSFWSIAVK